MQFNDVFIAEFDTLSLLTTQVNCDPDAGDCAETTLMAISKEMLRLGYDMA